jgi:orotate phosphoribosyltransferase
MNNSAFNFVACALENDVLRFGDFTLKSGRKSPYFFNMGEIKNGHALGALGKFYATSIHESFPEKEYDVIFGPAYKGITLSCTTAIALSELFNTNKFISYNRKEAKDHGEGGLIVGQSLKGQRAILIDDVITSGKTIYEAKDIIENAGGSLVGVAIALDRQEKALNHDTSAMTQISSEYGIHISSIITFKDIIAYITDLSSNHPLKSYLDVMLGYADEYSEN